MVELWPYTFPNSLIMACFYVLLHLNVSKVYQSEGASHDGMGVKEEEYQKISSINPIVLFHIFLQLTFYLTLKVLHNASRLISSSCEHGFSVIFPSLKELYHMFLLLYQALTCRRYWNGALIVLVIFQLHELLLYLFL